MNRHKGFSLIELIVVMSIVAVLGTTLVLNFRSSATNTAARHQVAFTVSSDLRRAQSMAVSESGHQGTPACGFGLHYVSPTRYQIFAHILGGASCGMKTYQPGDPIIETKNIQNSAMSFKESFADVYFELPYAKAYLGGDSDPSQAPVTIEIVVTGEVAGTVLSVHQSGKIDVTN